jgi:hypothetical protein
MESEETKVGDDTSVEDTVAETSTGEEITNETETSDNASKDAELARNYKARAEKAEKELKALRDRQGQQSNKPYDPDALVKRAEAAAEAKLEQRDLDEMEYPDDIKADIKKLAQLQGVSVRRAAKDPYIQHRIEQAKATERVSEATVTRTSNAASVRTEGQAPKFDMSTDEGRKAFKEWKQSRRK